MICIFLSQFVSDWITGKINTYVKVFERMSLIFSKQSEIIESVNKKWMFHSMFGTFLHFNFTCCIVLCLAMSNRCYLSSVLPIHTFLFTQSLQCRKELIRQQGEEEHQKISHLEFNNNKSLYLFMTIEMRIHKDYTCFCVEFHTGKYKLLAIF